MINLKYVFVLILLVLPVAACAPAEAKLPAGSACTAVGQTRVWSGDGTVQVCVPAGNFLMGAANDDPLAGDNEKPQHQVYLNAFWIDRTEVTNADFARCMAEGACNPQIYETSAKTYTPYAVHPDYQDFPALLYEDDVAVAYCAWAGKRLPTEAEWEKAARGLDGLRRYAWGNDLDCTTARYLGCDIPAAPAGENAPRCGYSGHCRVNRVDDYPSGASFYGALNMTGNVWEWVADWYSADYYAASPADNPTGPATGEFRVRRGGGAKSVARDMRVTVRADGLPHHYFDGQMGFRCASDGGEP